MQHIEIPLPDQVDCATVETVIDQALLAQDLTVTLRGTLKTYPGSLHWHAKSGHRPGTLEITLWPEQRRAWFSVQSGRKADWIESKMAGVTEAVQRELERRNN